MRPLLPKKTHLFTPGPTTVPDEVLRAMSAPVIHHRTPEFQAYLAKALAGMQCVIGTSNDVAIFAASGTGAMESAIANLVRPGDEIVVAEFGHFGKRWVAIGEAYGAIVHVHHTEWGTRPDPESVAAFVAEHPNARCVFTTLSETSTGTVSDPQAIGAAVRATPGGADRILVLDSISGLGAAEVRADEWGWDVVVSGSQKALMLPPGLAFASISPAAEEIARATAAQGRMYFDWPKTLDATRKSPPSTAFTPALTIIIGLAMTLDMMFAEGLDQVYERHVHLGRAARAGVKALGFELFSPDDDSSVVLTAVAIPDDIDGAAIPKKLRDYGVTVAGGQAHLKGKIVRLGHCGWMNEFDLITCIAAFERGLTELGIDVPVGAGVAAAQRSLTEVEVLA